MHLLTNFLSCFLTRTQPLAIARALTLLACVCAANGLGAAEPPRPGTASADYAGTVRPLLKKYCLDCHSTEKKKGDLDLQQFASADEARANYEVWRKVIDALEEDDMPPEDAPQPSEHEQAQVVGWAQSLLDEEIRARAGDPGRVLVRRLNNAEYNNTVRDLTGVDLEPARDFPGDGAAGEGFTNSGDALTMSPALVQKYLAAAKQIAAHAVLLPDGLRFSPGLTREDWTNEILAQLHSTYQQYAAGPGDGKLDFSTYLAATIVHRDELSSGKLTTDAVAAAERLNPRYLAIVWQTLHVQEPSLPLEPIRARWQKAAPTDVAAIAAEIRAWQAVLWKFNKIGSYMNDVWQEASNPKIAAAQPIRMRPTLAAGQNEVVLYLVARQLSAGQGVSHVIWQRPRLEGANQAPLLLSDLDRGLFAKNPPGTAVDEASLVVAVPSVTEVRLPASVFGDREFVVVGQLAAGSQQTLVQFEVLTAAPNLSQPAAEGTLCVGSADLCATNPATLVGGFEAFRNCFPIDLYHAKIVPDDETIDLRMYFREDEQLGRLFLEPAQRQRLDALWHELYFVSQQPLVELKNYATFMGFVSQDGPGEFQRVDEHNRLPVRQRAAEFETAQTAAHPAQWKGLLALADRAYRRPLSPHETTELEQLYRTLRDKEMSHEEALGMVLARILVAPSFLYRSEQPAAGTAAQPVSNSELATRLSYFLWASMPDAALRKAADNGSLTDPKTFSAEVNRMLADPKIRGLATEFGTQWLHIRDIRSNREKNERLFPTFDDELRTALFEESVLFFQDLFQHDRSVLDLVDADATFVNETLAKHYGIAQAGAAWRRVEGVKQFGRGGVLALGSVLTTQSGASRTSPVLRGNWLVEVLLGEKIPKPPANVPRLPEEVPPGDESTVRQMVEQHARHAECAVCHQRIDPFGFALEKYDPIGRRGDKDLGGRAIDTQVQLKDGTRFDGLEGLRQYLLSERGDDLRRQFCRKLLGYALGRSVAISDEPLIDEMLAQLKQNHDRSSLAVFTIVNSPQFRQHRALEATKAE